MTQQETITALAAELTRVGRMPGGIDPEHCTVEEFCSRTSVCSPEIVLAALSGVAAEAVADARLIVMKTSSGFWIDSERGSLGYQSTYHEALAAALAQIQS